MTLEVWYMRGIAIHYTFQSTFRIRSFGWCFSTYSIFENSKTRTTFAALTVFVAYRPVALNRRCGHRMMHCRHSPIVSLKISLTGVLGLYTAVMDTPTLVGYSIPFQKIPYFQGRDYSFTHTIIFFVVQYYYLVFREL